MVRAELLKLRTVGAVKLTAAIGVAGLLLTQLLFVTLLPAISSGALNLGDGGQAARELGVVDPGSASFQYSALSVLGGGQGAGSIGIAAITALAIGLLAATTDYRFGGIVQTVVAHPRRGGILVAKIAATAVWAALFGAVLALVSIVVLLVSTLTLGVGVRVSVLDVMSSSVRGIAVIVLLALLGLAVGMLVRSQLAGFLLVIAGLLAEPVVVGLLHLAAAPALFTRLLPMGLAQSVLAQPGAPGIPGPTASLTLLATLAGLGLAAAWAALRRRDV